MHDREEFPIRPRCSNAMKIQKKWNFPENAQILLSSIEEAKP